MLIYIFRMETFSYIDGIKGLHTNCRLASCFMSYANEHLSDYHGIAWFMLFVLLVLCSVNPLLTSRFPYKRSIVRNFVVWLMLFALLAERWCLIRYFRIAGPVWRLQLFPVVPPHKRSEALMSSFMFVQTSCWTNSGYASGSKTHESQIMPLLCNLSFRNWWRYWSCVRWNHWSPEDSRCKESLEWSFSGPVCGDSIAGGFPSQKVGLMFYLMFAWTSCFTNNRVASELKSHDAYAMSLLCVICQFDIPHDWTSR